VKFLEAYQTATGRGIDDANASFFDALKNDPVAKGPMNNGARFEEA
jgi:hypothetical protein